MNTTESTLAGVIDLGLRAAIRAPSPHNTQPWRFEVGSRHVDLLLDRERLLPVADPDGREALLSCGAALLNLRLAIHAAGRASRLDLAPHPGRPDLLATVWIGRTRPPTAEQESLGAAIERRTSNRRPFAAKPVPSQARHALTRAAGEEGCRLVLLERPSELGVFATLLRRADHLLAEDFAFQAELREWIAEHSGRLDGVPRSAGGPRASSGVLALRRYHVDESAVDRPFEQDPLVAVLAANTDTVSDQLRAGQAMQRALLVATAHGLSASFLSQPMEVTDTREALRELIGGRLHPQTVLRLGFGYPAPHTPRRPAESVTTTCDRDEESHS